MSRIRLKKKPSSHLGPAETQAKARRLLAEASPEILRLAPEAIDGGMGVAFFVFEPTPPQEGEDPAVESNERHAELVKLADGKPLTAVLAVDALLGLFAHLGEIPEVQSLMRKITTERDPKTIPIVFSFGPTFGVVYFDPLLHAEAIAKAAEQNHLFEKAVEVIQGATPNETFTLEAFIEVMLATRPAMMTKESRPLMTRFQERAKGLIAADAAVRTAPRNPVDVVIAGFGGPSLREAWTAGPGSFTSHIATAFENLS